MNDPVEPYFPIILLVEDNPDIREMTTRFLESRGFQVICAPDGLQALRMLESMSALPQLIILDLMMPVMDGFEFRHRQLESPGLKRIPVIVLSASNQPDTNIRTLKVAQYLRKPVSLRELLHSVQAGIDHSDSNSAETRI